MHLVVAYSAWIWLITIVWCWSNRSKHVRGTIFTYCHRLLGGSRKQIRINRHESSSLNGWTMIYPTNWRFVCQTQLSRAVTSNYIPRVLWDAITCHCPWCLLLAHTCSIMNTAHDLLFFVVVSCRAVGFIQISHVYFTEIGTWLPQYQWSNPDEYG